MMGVIYIRRYSVLGWSVAGILLLVIGFVFHNPILPVDAGFGRTSRFPPLVYVPDYLKGPRVWADAAILVEAGSGTVLFAKNELKRRAPASTTKMLTALVVLEKAKPDEIVQISKKAAYTNGSSLGLRVGDRIRLSELLKGVMLCSGNDGSVALAEHVAGSEKNFAELMNVKARELGANHSHFQNAHGLRAPSHYTCAFDLALIARYASAQPLFTKFVAMREEKIYFEGESNARFVRNTNKLLWSFAGADGIKTGTTNEAGHCLVASATRGGRRFIAVVLHSADRWGDCARLLEYGFDQFSLHCVARADRPFMTINIPRAKPGRLEAYPRRDLLIVIRKGEEGNYQKIVTTYPQALVPPIRRGMILGRVGYSYRGHEVESVDLIARRSVKRKGFYLFGRWWP